jgi:hypothetical protein
MSVLVHAIPMIPLPNRYLLLLPLLFPNLPIPPAKIPATRLSRPTQGQTRPTRRYLRPMTTMELEPSHRGIHPKRQASLMPLDQCTANNALEYSATRYSSGKPPPLGPSTVFRAWLRNRPSLPSQHIGAGHPKAACRCVCGGCQDGQVDKCQLALEFRPNSVFRCACGSTFGFREKFKEHLRTAKRRQVQCRCGDVFREDKFRNHLNSSVCIGDHPHVCWRPDSTHRYECTNRQEFVDHFNTCERARIGRPTKRKYLEQERTDLEGARSPKR